MSDSFTITGTIHLIKPTQVVSEKFSKREFVLSTEPGKYPQLVLLEATKRTIDDLDSLREGDEVKVEFNLRGREWNGPNGVKHFNTLQAWKIETVKATASSSGGSRPTDPGNVFTSGKGNDDSDLPFATCAMSDEPTPIARVLRGA